MTGVAQENPRLLVATASSPGAIGIVQLLGDSTNVLRQLTGCGPLPEGYVHLARFEDIDEGLIARVSSFVTQLMPHGGPRVMQRLVERLVDLGAEPVASIEPHELFPEALDRFEALTLSALARAASPMAIDPLLAQPALWRTSRGLSEHDTARSARLHRLLRAPSVVVVGAPNVGKSTLTNALLGRQVSITLDMPGTTRDYTAAQVELGGLVVNWHDTPGMRETDDAIEARAIDLAQRLVNDADLLIAMADPDHDWPELPRQPDLRLANKVDAGITPGADVSISARTGAGVDTLVLQVRDTLVAPEDVAAAQSRPWLFDSRLLED